MSAPVCDQIASAAGAVDRVVVSRGEWAAQAGVLRRSGAVLLGLWGTDERDVSGGYALHALFQLDRRAVVHQCHIDESEPVFPSVVEIFRNAERMERGVYDLMGLRADGGDTRQWLRHASWPGGFPLRRDYAFSAQVPAAQEAYDFVRVEGDGVHEIGVGPVHAGIIEPGHFRFSVVGEKVLRLEERLGYAHKGIEKRFEQLPLLEGHHLAARVSGDSAVAFSWAYCAAAEMVSAIAPSRRALYLRALHLERERLANHLGDLGALGNDAGFAFGLAQFGRLKEQLLRLNAAHFAARYLLDEIVPGGVSHDVNDEAVKQLLEQHVSLAHEIATLREIYDDHAGLQDRFQDAGRVAPALAAQLGLAGLAGRASGQARDLRIDLQWPPYDELHPRLVVHDSGDVAARASVRFDEALESIRLCETILQTLPSGSVQTEVPQAQAGAWGLGLVESWRGPVFVFLQSGPDGTIRRCHPNDASWSNWPVIEHAVIDNIVPDFPLINKSFNLSYSGHDL